MQSQYLLFNSLANTMSQSEVEIPRIAIIFMLRLFISEKVELLNSIANLITLGITVEEISRLLIRKKNLKELEKQCFYNNNQQFLTKEALTKFKLNDILDSKEIAIIKKSEIETGSSFNFSTIDDYDVKTLRKIVNYSKYCAKDRT